MRRTSTILILFVVSFLLISCNSLPKKDPDIHGYVIERHNDSIFVVSKHPVDFSDHGGVSEFYDAIVLDEAPSEVDVGHEVRVWYKGPVRESYPLGGTVGSLEIVEVNQPDEASLTREVAIKRAIDQISPNRFITITNVEFDAENKLWKISYKPIEYVEEQPPPSQTIEIEDHIN